MRCCYESRRPDCYVAITGCPEPQKDHATTMVRFARDCMVRMNELVTELSETLGEDTAKLGFRVGLHSGPVTAGVLRGQKARFQLFGDSVNTAARMESNGVMGRIHVSQATADVLTRAGKGAWVVPREEKIVAKGLGELQTYFVEPLLSRGSMASSLISSSYNETETAADPVIPLTPVKRDSPSDSKPRARHATPNFSSEGNDSDSVSV